MSIVPTRSRAAGTEPPGTGARRARVLVVFESGRGGTSALAEGAELAAEGAELSVVTLAPQASSRCCGPGPGAFNCAVREEAADELREARAALGAAAQAASFTSLAGTPEPPLGAWAREHGFEVILVARRRLARGGGRLARGLRRDTTAEVRIVG